MDSEGKTKEAEANRHNPISIYRYNPLQEHHIYPEKISGKERLKKIISAPPNILKRSVSNASLDIMIGLYRSSTEPTRMRQQIAQDQGIQYVGQKRFERIESLVEEYDTQRTGRNSIARATGFILGTLPGSINLAISLPLVLYDSIRMKERE